MNIIICTCTCIQCAVYVPWRRAPLVTETPFAWTVPLFQAIKTKKKLHLKNAQIIK